MADITMPESVESESIVLGSILIDGRDGMKKIGHLLRNKDFFDDRHRYIYRAMEKLYQDQLDIDVVTVSNLLRDRGYIDSVGGASYLCELANEVITPLHIVTHAKIVADRAALRNIIRAGRDIMQMTQGDEDLDELLIKAEERLKGVTRSGAVVQDKLSVVDLDDWRKIARDTEGRDGSIRGISTGIKGLDDMIEGFEAGEMMILTGHTKHGKSRLAANIAYNVAQQGKTVYYINTEMTKLQMGRRFNSMAGDKPIKGKIFLNDKAGLSYVDVIMIMENAKEKGCDLVIVDHLHFFSRSVENQTSEISKIAKDFKDAAVEFELPLLMLCHVQQADTKKTPTLQMIKNSSSIAQDADIVITVWMDDRPEADGKITEVCRLAHRSASNNKRKFILYNDGMLLSETSPSDVPIYDPNAILGERDNDVKIGKW
jgi:replicative DNA helicase